MYDQKFIKVYVYGACGMRCPEIYRISQLIGDCREIIAKEYMFYFSFENSICKDYITEKFFFILKHPIIPVVMGGGRYEHYVNIFV